MEPIEFVKRIFTKSSEKRWLRHETTQSELKSASDASVPSLSVIVSYWLRLIRKKKEFVYSAPPFHSQCTLFPFWDNGHGYEYGYDYSGWDALPSPSFLPFLISPLFRSEWTHFRSLQNVDVVPYWDQWHHLVWLVAYSQRSQWVSSLHYHPDYLIFSVLIWACFIVFVFGISLELLKFIRYKVQVKLHQSNSPSSEKWVRLFIIHVFLLFRYFSRTISIPHLVDTFLFALQVSPLPSPLLPLSFLLISDDLGIHAYACLHDLLRLYLYISRCWMCNWILSLRSERITHSLIKKCLPSVYDHALR